MMRGLRTAMFVLGVILLALNAGFVLFTLQKQGMFELGYNIITAVLNILYYLLELYTIKEK